MKISEMNDCIKKMRECYNFKDDETEVRLGDFAGRGSNRVVSVCTVDGNGTKIEMSKDVGELLPQNGLLEVQERFL